VFRNIEINVKSAPGSIAIMAFLILIAGIVDKHTNTNVIPESVSVAAAIMLGFTMFIMVYANTNLGLVLSLLLGFIPAFIILGFITPIGWILLLFALSISMLIFLLDWVGSHGL